MMVRGIRDTEHDSEANKPNAHTRARGNAYVAVTPIAAVNAIVDCLERNPAWVPTRALIDQMTATLASLRQRVAEGLRDRERMYGWAPFIKTMNREVMAGQAAEFARQYPEIAHMVAKMTPAGVDRLREHLTGGDAKE